MSDDRFYVQCVSGNPDHIMEAVPGSKLEAKCKKRAEAGKLDALCLYYDECPDCVEDTRKRAREEADYISMFGGPIPSLHDTCEDNCCYKNRKDIADSPYADQVQYITATA